MAKLNEGIAKIKEGSVLDTFYKKLLAGFQTASSETLPDFTGPGYVTISEDGKQYTADTEKIDKEIKEYQSITLKNAAYLLAETTVSSLGYAPDGGTEGCLPLSGGSLSGALNALYGFAAGVDGIKILEVAIAKDKTQSVKVNGQLHLGADGLWLNGMNPLRMDETTAILKADLIHLDSNVTCSGSITIGKLVLSKDGITFDGKEFYHTGNANLKTVDWTMKNGHVEENLTVNGTTTLGGTLSALYGVSVGVNGEMLLDLTQAGIASLHGDFDILSGGVKIDGDYVIHKKNAKVVSFSATNKTLNLGDDSTSLVSLQAGLYDVDSEIELISIYGAANFPGSFQAGHSGGNTLIKTYRTTKDDTGIVIKDYLRFGTEEGVSLKSDGRKLIYEGFFFYNETLGREAMEVSRPIKSSIEYTLSNSMYAPLDRKCVDLNFTTEADFYVYDKPLEGKTSVGISGSKTRILDKQLFFNDGIYWLAIEDGVKHYGNAYMTGSIGSVKFSSGFAGSGWKIYKNQLTGNICATFDELTIRKKMRVYELEVQKLSATNGSLWVSASCSGDMVEEIL